MARTKPKSRRGTSGGGGGSNTGLIVVNQPVVPEAPAPEQTRTAEEVKALLAGTNVTVKDSFIKLMGADEAYDQIERALGMLREFGIDPDDALEAFDSDKRSYGTYAWTYYGDKQPILVNNVRFGDMENVKQRYEANVMSGFHPEGTTYKDICAHEAGHRVAMQLERKLADTQIMPDGTKLSAMDAISKSWQTGAHANIIKVAWDNVKGNPEYKGVSKKEAQRRISGYCVDSSKSTVNNMETLAEALTDYYVNRDNAKTLSKEIARQVKRYLNS